VTQSLSVCLRVELGGSSWLSVPKCLEEAELSILLTEWTDSVSGL